MYIHGGGFVSGSAASAKGYCSMLAKYSGCKVVAIDYALAPEHAIPAGFNKGTFHAFTTIGTGTPETRQILEESIAFMRR